MQIAGRATLAGLGAITGYLVLADSKMDILGDKNASKFPQEEIDRQFSRSWTIETRFGLQFLGGLVSADDLPDTGNGILGIFTMTVDSPIGSNCLAGTAYDTTPSEIRGRASGDISAVASIAVKGSVISIHPAGSEAAPLLFIIGEDGRFEPNDVPTSDTLRAYGCPE